MRRWTESPISPRDVDRFLSKVIPEPNSGCWLWLGATSSTTSKERSFFFVRGKMRIAAKVSWVIHFGPFNDEGVFVCHKCNNPNCVNPEHLYKGDKYTNMRDAVRDGLASCVKHPWILRRARTMIDRTKPNGNSKITRVVVRDILERVMRGQFVDEIAPEVGLSTDGVRKIAMGSYWKSEYDSFVSRNPSYSYSLCLRRQSSRREKTNAPSEE